MTMTDPVHLGPNKVTVRGSLVDDHTRCTHYHSELDIIAIKFKCCHTYFPCYKCHEELTAETHKPERWNQQELINTKVILCGGCYGELTFSEYSHNSCIKCKAPFNPGCALHYHIYFDIGSAKAERSADS